MRLLQRDCLLGKGPNSTPSSEKSNVRMHPMVRKVATRITNDMEATLFLNQPRITTLIEDTWLLAQHVCASSKYFKVLNRNNFVGNKLPRSDHTVG